MAYRRRANCRFVPTVVKIANADCVCSGAQRAPCRLAMITAQIQRRKASGFVIARSEATWQSRSIRPDHRALPANTVTLRGIALRTPPSTRRVRSAIIPPNLGPARRSGNAATPHTLAFAILTIACSARQRTAGPGCPLPYKACAFARQLVQIGSELPEIATAPVGPLREPAGAQNRRRGALPCGGFWINRIIRCGQHRKLLQPRRRQRRQPCRHAGQTPSG